MLALFLAGPVPGAQVEIPEEEAARDLAAFAATYHDRATWETRAASLRRHILEGAELDPLPRRTPLRPVLHSRHELDGYTVEAIYFESFPGFFVTGNLYRPLEAEEGARPAGILCPHGHWEAGRFREDMQARCGALARMGAIVLAYDMVGWQESDQVEHGDPHALTYQLWNGMRALDLLEELGADPQRLGVTGASGGGTQTFLLAAVDERVAAAAPVVMVSAHFFGGCTCESGLPIHRSATHETNNAEIAALMAPRPLLIVSCGEDWTKNVPEVEYPYIRDVFRLYGAEDRVANAHFAHEGHDYGASKRRAVYPFLARHLALDRATGDSGDESFLRYLERDRLVCFDAEHPRPPSAETDPERVRAGFLSLQ